MDNILLIQATHHFNHFTKTPDPSTGLLQGKTFRPSAPNTTQGRKYSKKSPKTTPSSLLHPYVNGYTVSKRTHIPKRGFHVAALKTLEANIKKAKRNNNLRNEKKSSPGTVNHQQQLLTTHSFYLTLPYLSQSFHPPKVKPPRNSYAKIPQYNLSNRLQYPATLQSHRRHLRPKFFKKSSLDSIHAHPPPNHQPTVNKLRILLPSTAQATHAKTLIIQRTN